MTPADFMRFLLSWQHLKRSSKLTGIDGLREIVAQLDGFELSAAAWERDVLPARMDGYEPQMLDMLCLAGEVAWSRLSLPLWEPPAAPRLVPATPIALHLREHTDAWHLLRGDGQRETVPEAHLSESAVSVLDVLRKRGASFFANLRSTCDLDADDLRQAIGALVASGLVVSDGFSGLRALVWAARGRPVTLDRRANFAGRWTALSVDAGRHTRESAVELQAWTLLRRYGVVVRRLLARETNVVTWRELTGVYRRLEARGEVRGGRFVSGLSGEQFALPEAVEQLREVRRRRHDGEPIIISTADPLNLAGVVTAGDRLRAAGRNRVAYVDGVPIAALEGEAIKTLAPADRAVGDDIVLALRRRRRPLAARA